MLRDQLKLGPKGVAALTQIQLTMIKIAAQVTDLYHAITFMPNDEKN